MINEKVRNKILVTGAGGWLASHIIYQLLDKDYCIRGTTRSLKKSKFLEDFHPLAKSNLEIVTADLLNPDCWDEITKEIDFLIHVASPFTFRYKSEDELILPAVKGVENVYKAAIKNGVKRIIQTSSVCSIVYGHSKERYACDIEKMNNARYQWNKKCVQNRKFLVNVNNEESKKKMIDCSENHIKIVEDLKNTRTSCPIPQQFDQWNLMDVNDFSNSNKIVGYEKSKTLAEETAWKLIKETDIEFVVLCPGFIFGPIFDKSQNTSESTSHIKRVLLQNYPFVADVNSSHVDVRDAAECHVLALEAPKDKVNKRRFIVCSDDGNLDFKEQAAILSKHFRQYKFYPSIFIAPKLLVKLFGYLNYAARAAADKLDVITYATNQKTHEILEKKEWRVMEDSLVSHTLTLMKFNLIPKRAVPDSIINSYNPY